VLCFAFCASVGLIIGKQGATVREIQDCTGVHVNVSRDPPPDGRPVRLVTLRGTSQQVAAGEIEVRRVCAGGRVGVEGSEGSVGPSGGGGGGGGGFSGPRPGLGFSGGAGGREEVMLIPQQTISLVIGRGGETIRGIEMRSGAMVKVQREEADAAGMRMIKLIGTPEQCGAARGEIDHIVSSSREMGGQGVGRYGGPPGGGPGGYGPPQPGVPGVDGFAPPGGAGGGRPGMTTLTIPVHAASTGIIIGRGGEIVRVSAIGEQVRAAAAHQPKRLLTSLFVLRVLFFGRCAAFGAADGCAYSRVS
jgi:far upstream element-binding protein